MRSALAGSVVCLDSNSLIDAFETSHARADAALDLLGAIDEGRVGAVASELVSAEVSAEAFADRNPGHIDRYQRLISSSGGLAMARKIRDVLVRAARLRGEDHLKPFDAIHVATAQLADCHYFLTHDERLGRALADRPNWLKLFEIN